MARLHPLANPAVRLLN